MLRSLVVVFAVVFSSQALSASSVSALGPANANLGDPGELPGQLPPLSAQRANSTNLESSVGLSVIGDTFTIAPLLEDDVSAYYLTDVNGPTSHTFDDASEFAGNNDYGTEGSYVAVFEGVMSLSESVDRVYVDVTTFSTAGDPEPWVDVAYAGLGLTDWRLDIGVGSGGDNPISPGTDFTVIDSGYSVFNSAAEHLGTFEMFVDTSTSTSLSGVALLGNSGSDIAGVDVATIVMYWDIEYPTPADLALAVVDANDGEYAPGDPLGTLVGVANIGGEQSPEASFGLYASTDSVISSSDRLLGSFVIPALAGGASLLNVAPSNIPADLPNGSYYIGGIIDLQDVETTNNINYDPVPIGVSNDPEILVRPQALRFVQPDEIAPSMTVAEDSTQELLIAATQKALPVLIAEAADKGQVRVIIGLETPFIPEGRASAAERRSQRQAIQDRGNQLLAALAGTRHQVNRRFRYVPFMALTVGVDALQHLSSSPLVSSIHEDSLSFPTLASSNDVIGSPLAWAEGYDGSGQVVAVLDTGVDKNHPWFTTGGAKVVSEACYSTNSTGVSSFCPGGVESSTASDSGLNCDPSISGCDHGTHVAGIVAGNDGSGPNFGVARGADLAAMQVFSRIDDPSSCGTRPAPCITAYDSDVVAALERVFDLRDAYSIAAVNMSLGGGRYFSQAECDADNAHFKAAIDNLRSVGIASVVASGNDDHTDSIAKPGCVSSAVSVGATTDWDEVTSFSNIYPEIHLLAPGWDIDSSVPGGGVESKPGTSMAAPHVAGAWAVLKQIAPSADVDTVLSSLQSTATPVDDTRVGGYVTDMPRINLDLAMDVDRTTFGIFNDGPGRLDVTSIAPESPAPWISVSPAGPFTVERDGLQVVEVTIDFGLAPPGTNQYRLLITSNDPDESPWPDGVWVEVTTPIPIEPEYDSNPAPGSMLDFGQQEISTESASKIVSVSNSGNDDLALACSLSGPDATDFKLLACASPVAPAGSTELSVSCLPAQEGPKTATLEVATNDSDESLVTYALRCEGVLPPNADIVFEDGFESP